MKQSGSSPTSEYGLGSTKSHSTLTRWDLGRNGHTHQSRYPQHEANRDHPRSYLVQVVEAGVGASGLLAGTYLISLWRGFVGRAN